MACIMAGRIPSLNERLGKEVIKEEVIVVSQEEPEIPQFLLRYQEERNRRRNYENAINSVLSRLIEGDK